MTDESAIAADGVESDENRQDAIYSAKELKEIERKRQKAQKKKASKKRNKRQQVEVEADSAVEQNGASTDAQSAGASENGDASSGVTLAKNGESSKPTHRNDDIDEDLGVDIEYVGDNLPLDENDPNFGYFSEVFNYFKPSEGDELLETYKRFDRSGKKTEVTTANKAALAEQILKEEMDEKRRELEDNGEVQKMSRRKLRLSMQPSIAKLKEDTMRPDVVEWADVTSRDPVLLVTLKAYRNTVPVPRHWNAKRKYLAGKRGFERAPFELPEFIKRTGIMEMRESMWEKEEGQSLKGKMRERARPKLGKIDIDYQKLHDAFFRWQSKPVMTKMGELYYEGKELETQMREKKPGALTDELRIALGMPVGPNSQKFPPPWLIAMQRYGPPPTYPNLKVPGLNSPIPEGCAFGYHAGGWGKPPVDEYGKPLYGDVFGLEVPALPDIEDESKIERKHWGEMGSDVESSDEESEEEEDADVDGEEAPAESGFVTPAPTEGFATPSGMTSGIPAGVETPDNIEFRKKKGEESIAGDNTPAPLYTVLPEKRVDRISGQMMASTHVYDLSSKKGISADGVEVSLNPEDLDMSDVRGLEQKYEEQLRKQNRVVEGENEADDFSDMVAEHSAKQNRKRKAQETKKSSSGGSEKKKSNFKF